MTPQEKSNEIFDKMLNAIGAAIGRAAAYKTISVSDMDETAKQCALICVDEKIQSAFYQKELFGLAFHTVQDIVKISDEGIEFYKKWCDEHIAELHQVKKEIEYL